MSLPGGPLTTILIALIPGIAWIVSLFLYRRFSNSNAFVIFLYYAAIITPNLVAIPKPILRLWIPSALLATIPVTVLMLTPPRTKRWFESELDIRFARRGFDVLPKDDRIDRQG